MTSPLWLASLLLLPAVGAPLLTHTAFGAIPRGSRVVLSGAAGAVLVSLAMTLLTLAGLPWSVWAPALGGTLLAWAFRALLGVGVPTEPERPRGRVAAVALAAGLSGLCVLAALSATWAGAATSLDLVFFWGPKAQQFASARGVDVEFLRDASHLYMHPYYPPLVVNLYAFATMAAGRFAWTSATLTFPLLLGLIAVGLPGLLEGAASRARSAGTSALVVAALASLGILSDFGGNGDMPLCLFEMLAMALLLRADAAKPSHQLLAGLLLAGAATAKVEGLPLALAATGLFLVVRGGRPAELGRAALRLLAPTALGLCAWFVFGITRRIFSEYSEYGRFFDVHPEHWASIAAAIPRVLLGIGRGLPYLVPVVCLLASGRLSRRAMVPLGTAAALVVFMLFTYLHLPGDPAEWIAWSAARVFTPVALLFALATCAPAAEEGVRREAASPR